MSENTPPEENTQSQPSETQPDAADPHHPDALERALEAALFAAEEPMTAEALAGFLGDCDLGDVRAGLDRLAIYYAPRGVQLVERGKRWHFETAPDLAHILRREREQVRRLSRAATEVLAIIAYHEPVSRAEIEAVRGVQTSGGTLDVLMEAGWVKIAGRREVPGRPTIYATTPEFLEHFGLASRKDLPGIAELRATGLLDPVDDAYDMLMGDDETDPDSAEPKEAEKDDAENKGAEKEANTDPDIQPNTGEGPLDDVPAAETPV
jgi:segregation and condensation protein B